MDEQQATDAAGADATSRDYQGRWNRLVSTTNWEKGRIIFEWRAALVALAALPAECSDDAWSRRVGNVTPQHVGRLRRVWQRFGDAYDQYDGLYWSHFHAALDWNDAEMWLEGAVQNNWSVAEMRYARWDAHGAPAAKKPRDEDIVSAEVDEDYMADDLDGGVLIAAPQVVHDPGDEPAEPPGGAAAGVEPDEPASGGQIRPLATAELPDDLADGYESFKLALLRHKMAGWREVSRDDALVLVESLRRLVVDPAD